MTKEKRPKVSVVLPVYNAEAFVGEVLATIMEQSFTDFEVIVLDDGSKDGSAAVVKRYAKMDDRVRYYRQENRGGDKLGTTLNYAVSLAKGELIARADSDDPWMLDRLEKQVGYMDKHPKCVVCGGGAEIIDGEGRYVWSLISPVSDEDIRRTMTLYTPLNHGGVMFRKEAFLKAGEYRDVRLVEDFDLWVRMAELGTLHNLPEAVFRYRKTDGGISLSNLDGQKAAVGKIGRKWWGEHKPEFMGVGAIRKKLRSYREYRNGGALSWAFLEDTATIGKKFIKWDKRVLKGVGQVLAVAVSSKMGLKIVMKKLMEKHGKKVKFGMAGVINTVIDVGLFAVFANMMGVVAEWASVLSTSVAIVFSFFINYYWVWRSRKSKARTIPQFLVVTLTTAWGVQTGIIWCVKAVVGDGDLQNLLAKVCAIGVGMVVNYLLYKIIFTERKENGKK